MASSFGWAEQAAHWYHPAAQFRQITKDELQGYLHTLTNPHFQTALTCSCWKGNILQQTGVKHPAAEEEAERAEELHWGQVLMKEDLCWEKKAITAWRDWVLTGRGALTFSFRGTYVQSECSSPWTLLAASLSTATKGRAKIWCDCTF